MYLNNQLSFFVRCIHDFSNHLFYFLRIISLKMSLFYHNRVEVLMIVTNSFHRASEQYIYVFFFKIQLLYNWWWLHGDAEIFQQIKGIQPFLCSSDRPLGNWWSENWITICFVVRICSMYRVQSSRSTMLHIKYATIKSIYIYFQSFIHLWCFYALASSCCLWEWPKKRKSFFYKTLDDQRSTRLVFWWWINPGTKCNIFKKGQTLSEGIGLIFRDRWVDSYLKLLDNHYQPSRTHRSYLNFLSTVWETGILLMLIILWG